jgi:mannose-6-phosphate isomerase-like protein (cupin superfamily)
MRRVVTGERDGKAVFVEDSDVEATKTSLSAVTYHEVWRSDTPPTFPADGSNGSKSTFFPGADGYRFFILTIPPGEGHGDSGSDSGSAASPVDIAEAIREMDEKLPGIRDWIETDNPGMHRTDTVDMEIVLSGEIVLELDDGVEKMLRAGDTNIQNGTRHRWHNRGSEPAVMACFLIGGARK